MAECQVLVDYHNLHRARMPSFSRPARRSSMDGDTVNFIIEQLLSGLGGALRRLPVPPPDRLVVRLYGGWFQEARLTDDAQMVQRAIRSAPSRIGRCRFRCELAYSLLTKPDVLITHTLRQKQRTMDLRIHGSLPGCALPEQCHVLALKRLLDSRRCPETYCPADMSMALKGHEQKCVDVHMACDLLTLAQDGEDAPILLVTDDTDLVPAMIYAISVRERPITWAFMRPISQNPYRTMLEGLDVQVLSLFDS